MKTCCPYCGVGCGVDIKASGLNTFKISGDAKHPASLGKLCSKGSALADTLTDANRLTQPYVNGEVASWDSATDYIASELCKTIANYGRESVAFYVSGQLLTEDYYVVNKLTKGWLGTANIDTNSRLCMASSVVGHKRAFGSDTVPGCYADLEEADLVVLVGSNLAWCHPVLYQRIQEAKKRRPEMSMVVIDPRRTMTAESADLHLPILPDSDTALFNGLLHYLKLNDAFDKDYLQTYVNGLENAVSAAQHWTIDDVAKACDLDAGLVSEFYRQYCKTKKTVTVYSQGVNQSVSGTDKVNAIINCHLATGRIGKPGTGPFSITGQPNAMGGREVGGLATMLACHMELNNSDHRNTVQEFWQSPRIADKTGLCAVDMFDAVAEGRIKAIWIMGTNPVDSLPSAQKVKSALQRCPLVIVSDVVESTDTLECAHVKLPAQAWGEKDGTVTNSERCISRQRRLKAPIDAARADWWAVSTVAVKMGFTTGFNYHHPADIFREHAALSGSDNHGQRDFDISPCASLSNEQYDELLPFYWPWVDGDMPTEPKRFFGNGGYFTSDGRATMLPIAISQPENPKIEQCSPFALNTGRNRDQWHTMTRTGYSARLSRHLGEPYLAVHPDDARSLAIADADLVQVSSSNSNVLLRALITDRQESGHVFAPIHWTDEFASNARVNTLITARVDRYSKQPALKNQPVRVQRFEAKSYAYGIMRQKPLLRELPNIEYWASVPVNGGWQYECASTLNTDTLARLLSAMTCDRTEEDQLEPLEVLALNDSHRGNYSAASYSGSLLQSLFFISHEPVHASRSWVQEQLESTLNDRSKRWQLLAGRNSACQPDKGAIVCSCFSVGVSEIEHVVTKYNCADLSAVGDRLNAGTNCGSCRNEIQSILGRMATNSKTTKTTA